MKVTPGEIVVMAAGGVALIASFLPFWRFSAEGETESVTAWDPGLFPVASLIAVFALAAGALVALDKFANVNVNFLGFRVLQLVLALGAASVLLALGYLILDNGAIVGGELTLDDLETFINIEIDASRGIGYYLLLLGSIGSVVGGIVMANERKSAAPGSA